MLYLKSFCFNPFQENTYLVYTEEGDAFIIDPGNSNTTENNQIKNFLVEKQLKLTRLLLTHAHIDHILGNRYIFDNYGLLPEVHKADLFLIEKMSQTATMYGVPCDPSPVPEKFIEDGDTVSLGEYEFKCIYTPGHSPGSISFYNEKNRFLISGDVLFRESIGRTDLPRGDHQTLITAIREKLYILDNDVKVYSGHGPVTTIGHEKSNNPFINSL